ncbi:fe2og oxygenase family oxidoreductase [Moniliophthora roreri MCA 2997]|uniref:Fe2og oxygenase family oxidoreductase n=1 Tax=Moniliophthora roreri (strain MCA 2997) TaxID=1381753 RepID=V2XK48_MONRO|nr:fe2og oxygenase family oxidoreductase [Moniliophthora roreri MCA 2997]
MGTKDSSAEPPLPSQKRERSTDTLHLEFFNTAQERKRINLQISIPAQTTEREEKSSSSLFSSSPSEAALVASSRPEEEIMGAPATLLPPPIPGLFFDPSLLIPAEFADAVVKYCLNTYFTSPHVNQIMLFERAPPPSPSSAPSESTPRLNEDDVGSGLPPTLTTLLSTLSEILSVSLPPSVHTLLFPRAPSRARQAIINLYHPGEGITPHVDLLRRFGDGIIGVSFSSGCVMQFVKQERQPEAGKECVDADGNRNAVDSQSSNDQPVYDVYLPERSIIVMTGDARYRWTHGIARRVRDYVFLKGKQDHDGGEWIDRKVRLSITFRWLLPGAEVVGGDNPDLEE